ncbi:hypothetical protein SAMN05444339_10289 [Loktanella atrilutea]|uniref:Uncharacterized protein n=1 Tax=Loktanella atrilutea TaxID=366533 RepID=A0A1M4WFE4_LOKAT|nr:hypothetical protein [Loktanella atrilutea]SHE79672.1 hypothetical protein SAMN05444339_10289 [Loktanella atrilutea]
MAGEFHGVRFFPEGSDTAALNQSEISSIDGGRPDTNFSELKSLSGGDVAPPINPINTIIGGRP